MGGGKVKTAEGVLSLRFSFGALVAYEDECDGKSLIEGVIELQGMGDKVRFRPLLPILRAGFHDEKPDLSDEDVIAIVNQVQVKDLIEAIGEAAQLAFGEVEEPPAGNARRGKTKSRTG